MLYELIAIVRAGKVSEAKEIARTTGSLILSSNGVVRGLANWGTYLMTKPTSRNQARHIQGQHFVMRFDCAPETQQAVGKMLSLDPRMVRFGIVKLGDEKLEAMSKIGSEIYWQSQLVTK